MALYRPKNTPAVDALKLPDGSYVLVKDGRPVTVPAAEFEAQYDPFVPG
jgi:hypothetical protein